MLEFCGLGGEVTERHWVPLGTKDFASIIAALPEDVDAIYLGLGGGDAVNFLNQYLQAGGATPRSSAARSWSIRPCSRRRGRPRRP